MVTFFTPAISTYSFFLHPIYTGFDSTVLSRPTNLRRWGTKVLHQELPKSENFGMGCFLFIQFYLFKLCCQKVPNFGCLYFEALPLLPKEGTYLNMATRLFQFSSLLLAFTLTSDCNRLALQQTLLIELHLNQKTAFVSVSIFVGRFTPVFFGTLVPAK